nr:ribosomal protein S2 [Meringosphaera mediterranea]
MAKIQITDLVEAGVHFGHKARRWNPKMFPYLYAEHDGIHLLDVVQTLRLLEKACSFSKKAARRKKKFLFVGTKPQAAAIVAAEAKRSSSYYINNRWLGGILTNWKTLRTRVERLKFLEQEEQSGLFEKLPKKEAAVLKKELDKLRKNLDGIKKMKKLPDILIVIDQHRELTAIKEARRLKIPIISILDTNCDPDLVDIPIPGNDDSGGSIQLILKALSDSIIEGKESLKRINAF